MYFKVSEKIKEELLEKLQDEAIGNLIKDVDNLKNKNILSEQVVRYCKIYTDEPIELEDEQIDDIISNLSEDEKDFNSDIIKEIKNTKKIKLLYLSGFINLESTDKKIL